MEKIIENGTEVLLFQNGDEVQIPKNYSFIRGIVINSEQKEYDCMHGSPLIKQIYTVQDENGKIYYPVYKNAVNGFYIRTIEEELNYVREIIPKEIQKLKKLEEEIDLLNKLDQYLEQKLEEKSSKFKNK